MVRFSKLTLLLAIFTASVFYAQNISLSATTDSYEYKVGDFIKYTLEIKHGYNISVSIPSVKDSVKNLEFIQALEPQKNDVNDNVIEKYTFLFSKYDSSLVTIPSYNIYYKSVNDTSKKFLTVNPVTIVVKTMQVNQQEDIRDVKQPIKLPLNWLLIILIALGVILTGTAGYFLYRYYRKKKLGKEIFEPKIIIPPHEIALSELKELEQKKLWQNGYVKEYHSDITGIVRKYFEGRFNFRALEQTSQEILACLSYIDEGRVITKIADDFFSNADLVKFAKFQPMPNVNDEMMKQAYVIVNETVPRPKQLEIIEQQQEAENAQ